MTVMEVDSIVFELIMCILVGGIALFISHHFCNATFS